MKKIIIFPAILIVLFYGISSCQRNSPRDYYHPLKNATWQRFEPIRFAIPLTDTTSDWDILFFLRHTRDYEFNTFEFNMTMTTPAGEERIREYQMDIRTKDGSFTGTFQGDTCEVTIPLKKKIHFQKKGALQVEIEALVPRVEILGISGAGIRMVPVR